MIGTVNKFHIIRPQTPEEFDDYFDLRWRILRAPWHQPHGSERDEFEDLAEHISIQTNEGRTIGVGRLHNLNPNEAQIRYMAVEEGYRGQGIGEMIYSSLERVAKTRDLNRIIVHARISVVRFYKRLGFQVTGDGPTLFNEIRHKVMEKVI